MMSHSSSPSSPSRKRRHHACLYRTTLISMLLGLVDQLLFSRVLIVDAAMGSAHPPQPSVVTMSSALLASSNNNGTSEKNSIVCNNSGNTTTAFCSPAKSSLRKTSFVSSPPRTEARAVAAVAVASSKTTTTDADSFSRNDFKQHDESTNPMPKRAGLEILRPAVDSHIDHKVPQAASNNDSVVGEKQVKPLKVLFLSSDTGGGHRASAESLAKQFLSHYPGTTYDLLDIWTEEGCLPYRIIAPAYKHLSKHPAQWRMLYHASNTRPYEWFVDKHSTFTCEKKIRKRIKSYNPDVVVSVHPAMNYCPLRSVKKIGEELGKHIPFFTVVTDYGSGHCTWFQPEVEKMFVASDRIRKLAKKRGNVPDENLIESGLPIRKDFDTQATALGDRMTEEGKSYQLSIRKDLGIDPNKKTILVMGGGEGAGGLKDIVDELYASFTKRGIDATIVVVCGRNEKLVKHLKNRDWDDVIAQSEKTKKRNRALGLVKKVMPSRRVRNRVNVYLERKNRSKVNGNDEGQPANTGDVEVKGLGFVTNMAEYMVAADILVTKAGPGTIAEAAAVGLPVMLTSFLPGQEAGNVDVVLDGGFGAYCEDLEGISDEVSSWLMDDSLLANMSRAATKEGHPHAASDIVLEIGKITHRYMEQDKSKQGQSINGDAP